MAWCRRKHLAFLVVITLEATSSSAMSDDNSPSAQSSEPQTWTTITPDVHITPLTGGGSDQIEVVVDLSQLQSRLPDELFYTNREGRSDCVNVNGGGPNAPNSPANSPNSRMTTFIPKGIDLQDGAAILSVQSNIQAQYCVAVPRERITWGSKDVGFGIKTRVPTVNSYVEYMNVTGNPSSFTNNIAYKITSDGDKWIKIDMDIKPNVQFQLPPQAIKKLTDFRDILNITLSEKILSSQNPNKKWFTDYRLDNGAFIESDSKLSARLVLKNSHPAN